VTEWRDAAASGQLSGSRLVSPSTILQWLDSYGHLSGAVLGGGRWHDKWWAIPLLHLEGAYYPAHFEDVICNHCKKRCGLSACPDTTSLWWPGCTSADVWALFTDLPVLQCPHCHGPLTHRQTFWFAPDTCDP
jgi:hypothetical protein